MKNKEDETKKYNYYLLNDRFIIFIKKEKIKSLITSKEIQEITNHTSNTWQYDRDDNEMKSNTFQGKKAEDMFADFIEQKSGNTNIKYVSYDDIRQDNYKKHAPFDGLIYKTDNPLLNDSIKQIVKDVSEDEFGRIKENTFNLLRERQIYTVEIKSSKIPKKDYDNINLKNFNKKIQQEKLINNLLDRDLIKYPKYTRNKGDIIHSFNTYLDYVVREHPQEYGSLTPNESPKKLREEELKETCDIYTRIFIDDTSTESFIGYILGYIHGVDFYKNPSIINLYQPGKSEKALYYVYPFNKANKPMEIFIDNKLWGSE